MYFAHLITPWSMTFIKEIVKKILLKGGYTVLRGDLRHSIQENTVAVEIPPHLLANARVCTNRYEVLKQLPGGGTAVEVGVGYGDFSRHILHTLKPDTFIAIDSFGITEEDEPWGRTHLKDNRCSHYEYYCRQFDAPIREGNMKVLKGLSWDRLSELPDRSIDYLYLDADHSYGSVAKEIKVLKHKMKPQGIIQFNDYTLLDQNALIPYGVPKAVHEFMVEENYEMLYFCLHPQGFYDVVVRKLPAQR